MGWLYEGVGTVAPQSRLKARPVSCHQSGAVSFFGGQVWAMAGDTVTVKFQAWNQVVTADVAIGMFAAPVIVGDAVIVQIENDAIVAVTHGRPAYTGSDQAASVARGEFHPALLNGRVTGVPVYQDGRE